jgi:hypothetical protein
MPGGCGYGSSGWGDPLIYTPDPFDSLLSNVCGIYRIKGGNLDKYGIADHSLILIQDNIACRLSTLGGHSPHPGMEWRAIKELAIADYKLFLRPQSFDITPSNWAMVEGRSFDIVSALELRQRNNPDIHHLELFLREVQP